MTEVVSAQDVERFYKAALVGLRFLDQAQGREARFGAGPDALWTSFRGYLETSDRVDLLCRDASVKWEAAFSAARVFGLPGLAPDEPFGPDWPGLEERATTRLWGATASGRLDSRAALEAVTSALDVAPSKVEGSLSELRPTSKILIGGLSATARAIQAFLERTDVRWSDQVVVVADRPAERQLAGLAAVILRSASATRIVRPQSPFDPSAFTIRFASSDASPDVGRAVRPGR